MSGATIVNDNVVDIDASAHRNNRETAARRLAADLPRGDDRIREVSTSVLYDASVWIDSPPDVPVSFDPPAGYEVAKVFFGTNGGVCINLNEVDA